MIDPEQLQREADMYAADLASDPIGWSLSDRKHVQYAYRSVSEVAASKTPQPAGIPRPA